MSTNLRRASGFSLIELLVVIAIISVLLTLVLAGISGARRSARYAAGGINLRSMAQTLTVYCNDHKGDFLNPFSPTERTGPSGQPIKWTDALSTGPDGEVWNFENPYPSYQTEGFSSYWYSYLAEYRGGGRYAPEMFSPADPSAAELEKDFSVMSVAARSRCLIGSSFLYSPAFWIKPEFLGFGPSGPERLRTANLASVLWPTKKVLVWDSADFSGPRSGGSKLNVVSVDGTQTQLSTAELAVKAASNPELTPVKFALGGGPGILAPDTVVDRQPDPSVGVPGYFAYTRGGVRGRDLP